jgi:hypothetical protein
MTFSSDKEIKGLFKVYDHIFKEHNVSGNILEIGVHQGGSLEYAKSTGLFNKVVGVDIKPSPVLSEGIDFHNINQSDGNALKKLSEQYGGFDVVIDDGCHIPSFVIESFNALWPVTRKMYVIEDWDIIYDEDNLTHDWVTFISSILCGWNRLKYARVDISFNTNNPSRHSYLAVIK